MQIKEMVNRANGKPRFDSVARIPAQANELAPVGQTAMANKPTTETNTQNNTQMRGRILKHGMLAAPSAVRVRGVSPSRFEGKLDVGLVLDGQDFILSLSTKSPDFEALTTAFGDPSEWTGCTVLVSDGKVLKQVNVRPIADAKGKPVS